MKMTPQQLAENTAKEYWETHQQVNDLAQFLRPSGSGSTSPVQFMHRVSNLSGWQNYCNWGLRFRGWLAARQADFNRNPRAENLQNYVTEFVNTTGVTHLVLDLYKIVEYMRRQPLVFGAILLSTD